MAETSSGRRPAFRPPRGKVEVYGTGCSACLPSRGPAEDDQFPMNCPHRFGIPVVRMLGPFRFGECQGPPILQDKIHFPGILGPGSTVFSPGLPDTPQSCAIPRIKSFPISLPRKGELSSVPSSTPSKYESSPLSLKYSLGLRTMRFPKLENHGSRRTI